MKTAEELARKIVDEAYDPYVETIDIEEVAAFIRADREELLNRVVEVIVSAAESHSGGATPTEMGALVGICIAVVRKEAL